MIFKKTSFGCSSFLNNTCFEYIIDKNKKECTVKNSTKRCLSSNPKISSPLNKEKKIQKNTRQVSSDDTLIGIQSSKNKVKDMINKKNYGKVPKYLKKLQEKNEIARLAEYEKIMAVKPLNPRHMSDKEWRLDKYLQFMSLPAETIRCNWTEDPAQCLFPTEVCHSNVEKNLKIWYNQLNDMGYGYMENTLPEFSTVLEMFNHRIIPGENVKVNLNREVESEIKQRIMMEDDEEPEEMTFESMFEDVVQMKSTRAFALYLQNDIKLDKLPEYFVRMGLLDDDEGYQRNMSTLRVRNSELW